MELIKRKECITIALSFVVVVLFGIEVCYVAVIAMLVTLGFRKGTFRISLKGFSGRKYYFALLLLGMVVGLVYTVGGKYTTRNYLKHFIYVTFPFLFFLVGRNLIRNKGRDNSRIVLRTLFYCGIIYSIYDLLKIVISFATHQVNMNSLYNLRASIGTGEQYAVYTLFLGICFHKEIGKIRHYKAINTILGVEILIHFSRLNILLTAIFGFFLIKKGIKRKYIKYIFAIVVFVIAIMTIFPNMSNELLGKIMNSLREISTKQNVWTREAVIANWRGYEAYCETVKFNNSSIIEKILGGGFGTLLNVGEYAHLVTTEDSLPYLHNGFFTILMIWGLVGEILYIFMLGTMYKNLPSGSIQQKSYAKCIVITLLLFTLLVHGPLFSVSGGFIFLYVGILSGLNNSNQITQLVARIEGK